MKRHKLILKRRECSELATINSWVLVYGRRKTGKTWLLRNCVDWNLYATMIDPSECIIEYHGRQDILPSTDCINMITKKLRHTSGTIVLDEFQRLPRRYWEHLSISSHDAEANLVLCGSSLGILHEVFDRHSPLLGLLQAYHVDLANVADTILSLHEWGLDPYTAILWTPITRDPWTINHLPPNHTPWEKLSEKAFMLAPIAKSLIGEIFVEEERQYTRTYETILRLLSKGYWNTAQISVKLYEAGLTTVPHPGNATGPLKVLEKLGLVERIPLWKTRGARTYYRHRSPILSLLYHTINQIEELDVRPSPAQLASRYGIELQFTLAELLAEYYGLRRAYSMRPDGKDIDILLLDGKGNPQRAYEVKMGKITAKTADETAKWLREQGIVHTGIIALKGTDGAPLIPDELLEPEDILDIAARSWKRAKNA